jgi:hypothetical protein
MMFIWFVVLVVLGVSLYNYFDSINLNQLTSTTHNNDLFDHRNKKYGAYAVRKSYNTIMLLILSGTVALFGLTMGAQYGFGSGRNDLKEITKKTELLDTTLLSLYEPPKDEVPTLPPSYSIKSSQGSGGENQADQEEQEETKESTTGKETENPDKPVTKSTKPKSNDADINKMDAHVDDVLSEAKARAAARQAKKEKEKQDALTKQGVNTKGSNGNEGSKPKTKKSNKFDLEGRTPFNDDDWYLQNPAYLCGKGVAGSITVKIKVDGGGKVTYVEALNASGIDDCIVRNAEKYAKNARFNSSSKSSQEGTITYYYQAQ